MLLGILVSAVTGGDSLLLRVVFFKEVAQFLFQFFFFFLPTHMRVD